MVARPQATPLGEMLVERSGHGRWNLKRRLIAAGLKQTAWVLLPFLILAWGPARRRGAALAAAVAGVVVIPLIAWNPAAFVEACAAPVDDQRSAQLNAHRRGCYVRQAHAMLERALA